MERLKKIGNIVPKASKDVAFSKLGIGFEKLDRNVFDPEKAYDKVGAIGIKWVRIQSGWARTEKQKGVYDFEWIDSIVDNLIARGLVPWVCLCYGNALYNEEAKIHFGAVGCAPIHNKEQKQGWANYVSAFAEHFKGRVEYYEVWNEPDGDWCWKSGANGREYGEFVVATSKALKKADKNAKVIGGSVCKREISFLNEAFRAGMAKHIDAITFHEYTADESSVSEKVNTLHGLVRCYTKKNIEIIQGESGSQSRSGGNGALKTGAWTPRKQAKQQLRHAIADFLAEVKFSSYFTTVDMIEALHGVEGQRESYQDYGYFGVLGADFDENGFATGDYTPKMSYYSLQNLASLFAEHFEKVNLPILRQQYPSPRHFGSDSGIKDVVYGSFEREDGTKIFAYWSPTNLMTTEFEGTISWEITCLGSPKLVDPMDGAIYEIPESLTEVVNDDCIILKNIPIKDYPMFLVFGNI